MLAQRIKLLRSEKEINLRDMAKDLNISTSTLSNYENNYREPNLYILSKIAEYFNVSIDYLLGKSDIKNPYKIVSQNELVILNILKEETKKRNIKLTPQLVTKLCKALDLINT